MSKGLGVNTTYSVGRITTSASKLWQNEMFLGTETIAYIFAHISTTTNVNKQNEREKSILSKPPLSPNKHIRKHNIRNRSSDKATV